MPTVFGDGFFSENSELLFNQVASEKKVIRAMEHVRKRHFSTYAHSVGVARLMAEYAISGIHDSNQEIQKRNVRLALLHDLGKLSVATAILDNNCRRLNKNEWKTIKQHSTDGFQRYAQTFNPTEGLPILLHHTFQANSYPDIIDQEKILQKYSIDRSELAKDQTIESAILLAVADSMEARFPDPPNSHINGVRRYSNRFYPVSDLPGLIYDSLTESGRIEELGKKNYLESVINHSDVLLRRIYENQNSVFYDNSSLTMSFRTDSI